MNGILGVNVGKAYTTKEFALGQWAQIEGITYEFAGSASGCNAYKLYRIDEAGDASTAHSHSTTLPCKLGCPQVAIGAGEYGWFVRQGDGFLINALASCAKDVVLYTSATAGAVDDTSTSQTKIAGLRINADVGAGAAENVSASAAIPMASNL